MFGILYHCTFAETLGDSIWLMPFHRMPYDIYLPCKTLSL